MQKATENADDIAIVAQGTFRGKGRGLENRALWRS